LQNLARFRRQLLLVAIALVLVLPVLTVFSAWLPGAGNDLGAFAVVREMFATVLPGYIRTTVALGLMVALGSAVVGTLCAAVVTLFDFRGRKTLEWLLLLPLAMPAYVTAYAYTDFLQFSGPLQVWMRASFGLQGRLLPEVRSLGGAVLVFVVSLYPYVYLLARTALSERAAHLMEAARLLGASMPRRIWAVALPMARPAVVAGVALVMMETLADFGVVSYFGIQTFTTGIYKAWLSMENRSAAAQLATMLLVLVLVVLQLELRAQRRMRFVTSGGARLIGRGPAVSPAGCALPGGLVALCVAGAAGLCAARHVHAAALGGRLVGDSVGPLCAVGRQQHPLWGHHCRAGRGHCHAGRLCGPPQPGLGHAQHGGPHQPGLCGARRGDRRGPAAASGLGAAGVSAMGLSGADHCDLSRHHLGLSGALHCHCAAVPAERLHPHSQESG